MSTQPDREQLIETVLRGSRRASAQAALFSQAVADRLGLAGSDIECLDVLAEEGRLTVGRLAELTGLTTGSATRMVDRLEQAGFVRRIPDPADRRRVLVEPAAERMAQLSALHGPLNSAGRDLIDAFDDAQLAAIARYVEGSVSLHREQAALLRRQPETEASPGGSFSAPVAGVGSARLVFVSGVPSITVRGDPTLADLYRAGFEGPVARVRVRDGTVTVTYPHVSWFDWRGRVAGQDVSASAHWRRDQGELVLNTAVPWAIELRGGASRLTAHLQELRLVSIEMKGGVGRIDLTLPRPSGVIPIRIDGATSRMSVRRPAGVAMGLDVRGAVAEVDLDGEVRKGMGHVAFETPGATAMPDRYEIEVRGGASKISVSTY